MQTTDKLEQHVAQLLDVLDEDAAHIRCTLEHLNRLRAAVIRRDEAELQQLLEAVAAEGQRYHQVEMRRQRIREAIASQTGGAAEALSLSRLCEIVEGSLRDRLQTRQAELKELVQALRMEHTCTMLLLRECSRLNRMLLNGILGRSQEAVTYTARGSEVWHTQNDMVNMRL